MSKRGKRERDWEREKRKREKEREEETREQLCGPFCGAPFKTAARSPGYRLSRLWENVLSRGAWLRAYSQPRLIAQCRISPFVFIPYLNRAFPRSEIWIIHEIEKRWKNCRDAMKDRLSKTRRMESRIRSRSDELRRNWISHLEKTTYVDFWRNK